MQKRIALPRKEEQHRGAQAALAQPAVTPAGQASKSDE